MGKEAELDNSMEYTLLMNSPVIPLNGNEILELQKRVSDLELALADRTSSYNLEVIELQEQLAKMRASFEKNELERHTLEYELSLTRKHLSVEKRNNNKEGEIRKKELEVLNDELKRKCLEVECTEGILNDQKILFDNEKENLLDEIQCHKAISDNLEEEKEKIISNWKSMYDDLNERYRKKEAELGEKVFEFESAETVFFNEKKILEQQKESLMNEINYHQARSVDFKKEKEDTARGWKKKYEELNSKYIYLEGQRIELSASVQKLIKDKECISSDGQELRKKNKLKLKELHDQLAVESARYIEINNILKQTEQKFRDLEMASSKGKEVSAAVKANLSKRNDEISQECDRLNKQLSDKTTALSKVNVELKHQGTKVDVLNDELNQVKAQLSSYEGEKNELVKELRLMLKNYSHLIDPAAEHSSTKSITEVLKEVLDKSEFRIKESEKKLHITSLSFEKLKTEFDAQLEVAGNKESALVEAERLVKKAQDGLSACQIKCAGVEEHRKKMEGDISFLEDQVKQRDERIQSLIEEVNLARLDADRNTESAIETFQVIYDLLLNDAVHPTSANNRSLNEMKDEIIQKLKENILYGKSKVDELHKLDNDHSSIKKELHQHKQALKKLRKVNSELLSQSENRLANAEQHWLMEKQELEKQFNQKLDEFKASYKAMELERNNAISVNEGIEGTLKEVERFNKKVQKELQKFDNENQCMASAIVLLTGGLWALLLRHQSLCAEKVMMVKMLRNLLKLKENMLELHNAIDMQLSGKDSRISNLQQGRPLRGIFRFRVAVIAVLVAIRFYKIGMTTKAIKCGQNSYTSHNNLIFYGTSRDDSQQKAWKFKEKSGNDAMKKEVELSKWMRSNILKNVCLNSLTPLINLVKNTPKKKVQNSEVSLLDTICTCYTTYLDSIMIEMDNSLLLPIKSNSKKNSLMYKLGKGLKRLLAKDNKSPYSHVSVSKITSALRESILHLIDKLHSCEIEKKSLTAECKLYKEEHSQLKCEISSHIAQVEEAEKTLKIQICDLEKQLEGSVSDEQFNEVCCNLDSALQREENLQTLLKEQTKQIYEMSERIEKGESSYLKSVDTLTRESDKYHSDLHRLQTKTEELKSHLLKLEEEKQDLNILIEEKKKSMDQFTGDRDWMREHLHKITSLLRGSADTDGAKFCLNQLYDVLVGTVLPEKLFAFGGNSLTQEMKMCQSALKSFVDCHRRNSEEILHLRTEKEMMENKIVSLQHQGKSHRLSVQKLKKHISLLCQEDTGNPKVDSWSKVGEKEKGNEMFVPLAEYRDT